LAQEAAFSLALTTDTHYGQPHQGAMPARTKRMRFLFLGDIVGKPGRTAVRERLPGLIARWKLDCVVINGENATHGFGISEDHVDGLFDAGADAVTLGNHAFDQKEALVFIARQPKLVRPLNLPKGTPGRGASMIKAKNGADVLVINALGRVFMNPIDCPFRAIDAEVTACKLKQGADIIFVDFHAEATSEKQSLGVFLDGRVTAVVGTHTHAPTGDHRVLPHGTAFQSDVGMCGAYDSVLGMDSDEPVQRFLSGQNKERFKPAGGVGTLCGLAVDVDDKTGLARNCHAIRVGGVLAPLDPPFWS
jgi:2',3'-cyclic-nucleotide 2'-phosphodiesterase